MTLTAEFIHGKGFEANIVRTNRIKTITVKVEQGKVSVVVPKAMTKERLEELVAKKSRWIREKLRLQREHRPPTPKEYVSGECFTCLGRNYRLRMESGSTKSVKSNNGRLTVQVPPSVKKRDSMFIVPWWSGIENMPLRSSWGRRSDIPS